jgi:hypothetical protein
MALSSRGDGNGAKLLLHPHAATATAQSYYCTGAMDLRAHSPGAAYGRVLRAPTHGAAAYGRRVVALGSAAPDTTAAGAVAGGGDVGGGVVGGTGAGVGVAEGVLVWGTVVIDETVVVRADFVRVAVLGCFCAASPASAAEPVDTGVVTIGVGTDGTSSAGDVVGGTVRGMAP